MRVATTLQYLFDYSIYLERYSLCFSTARIPFATTWVPFFHCTLHSCSVEGDVQESDILLDRLEVVEDGQRVQYSEEHLQWLSQALT